jgi:hypothetical protein
MNRFTKSSGTPDMVVRLVLTYSLIGFIYGWIWLYRPGRDYGDVVLLPPVTFAIIGGGIGYIVARAIIRCQSCPSDSEPEPELEKDDRITTEPLKTDSTSDERITRKRSSP